MVISPIERQLLRNQKAIMFALKNIITEHNKTSPDDDAIIGVPILAVYIAQTNSLLGEEKHGSCDSD